MESKSIFTKALILVFIFFAILMVIFGLLIYHTTAQTMKKQMGNKCIGIATAVAVMIEQDIAGYKWFLNTLDTDSDYYMQLKADMEKIRFGNRDNIAFLYAEIRVSDTEMMYIFDGELAGSDTFSPPGSVDKITETRRVAYDTNAPYIGDFVTTAWGTLLSAYAPVTDPSTGELIGLVGADVSIEQYNEVMRYQRLIIIGSTSILLLMVATVLFLSSEKVERMIMRDNLTGAYNRSYFLRCMRRYMKESRKKNIPLTIFMADLDHFKKVNDTYGHPFGDIVLESVCNTISGALRKTDCFARYGGEEFVAALPGLGPERAVSVVDRIREKVENTPIFNEEHNKNVSITISIGVTHLMSGQTVEDVLNMADKALYHAKITRNTVAVR